MRLPRFLVAAVVGFLLYQYVVVYIGGFLAAVQIPAGYFAFFGHKNLAVAHAILNLGLHTFPVAVLVAGGALATHRFWPTRKPMTWAPIALGMLGCLLLWVLEITPSQGESLGFQSGGPLEELRLLFAIPWWAASNLVAPWLGVAVAAWLMSKGGQTARRGGA